MFACLLNSLQFPVLSVLMIHYVYSNFVNYSNIGGQQMARACLAAYHKLYVLLCYLFDLCLSSIKSSSSSFIASLMAGTENKVRMSTVRVFNLLYDHVDRHPLVKKYHGNTIEKIPWYFGAVFLP